MPDVIRMPDRRFRRAEWTLSTPIQRNPSEFSGTEQQVRLPGASRWALSAEHVPLISEESARAWRSFVAKQRGGENPFVFFAAEGPQAADTPIISNQWHNTIDAGNTTVSGRTVTKVAGTNGAYDAGAVSSAVWVGACTLTFRAASTAIGFFAGINTDPLTDNGFSGIDHCFRCDYDGGLSIYESGTQVAVLGTYTTDDLFMIHYSGTLVRYYWNGWLVRSVTVSAGLSFRFDCSINFYGAAITDIIFQNGSTISGGATSASLSGLPAGAAQALKDGWFATAILQRGGAQLVVITGDVSNVGGTTSTVRTVSFLPELRAPAIGFIVDDPFAVLRMTNPQAGYVVDPGQVYGFALDAVEAF